MPQFVSVLYIYVSPKMRTVYTNILGSISEGDVGAGVFRFEYIYMFMCTRT